MAGRQNSEVAISQRALRKLSARVNAGRAFSIKTSPISLLFKSVMEALRDGAQGMIVCGLPRIGKSRATRWVLKNISEFFDGVPYLFVSLRDRGRLSEAGFFEYLLSCAKHRYIGEGKIDAKRTRFSNWMIARARKSPLNVFVLAFDEANLLKEEHYIWILNMSNELDDVGLYFFVLLVGQEILLVNKQRLMEIENGEQIVGRFMSIEHKFRSIQSEPELAACLEEFDKTCYPEGSGEEFPRLFIPIAFTAGFRLRSLSEQVWEECVRVWTKAELDASKVELPMFNLTRIVVAVLNIQVVHDSEKLIVSSEQIAQAVDRSMYSESAKIRKIASDRIRAPRRAGERRS